LSLPQCRHLRVVQPMSRFLLQCMRCKQHCCGCLCSCAAVPCNAWSWTTASPPGSRSTTSAVAHVNVFDISTHILACVLPCSVSSWTTASPPGSRSARA
jgi:hypothetical protein